MATVDIGPQRISLFESDRNATHHREPIPFSLWGALTLRGQPPVSWWEITVSIFLWMTISYAFVYLGGALVAVLRMRKHPYFLLVSIPLIAMCVIGPATVGVLSSMALGFTLSSSDKTIVPWQCMILGIVQTLLVLVVSFSRLLGTL